MCYVYYPVCTSILGKRLTQTLPSPLASLSGFMGAKVQDVVLQRVNGGENRGRALGIELG